jgi:hypothetical protein
MIPYRRRASTSNPGFAASSLAGGNEGSQDFSYREMVPGSWMAYRAAHDAEGRGVQRTRGNYGDE